MMVRDRLARHEGSAVAVVCLLGALGQWLWQQDNLHDAVLRSPAGLYDDARDYVLLATALAEGRGFAEVFSSGWRLPGYPGFLAIFHQVSESPWKAARYAQVLLCAVLPLFAYLAMRPVLARGASRLLPAVALVAWPPLYYFTTFLTAETLTIVLAALLYVQVLAYLDRPRQWLAVATALTVVLLTAMKPNNILLTLPAFAAVWLVSDSWRIGFRFLATIGAGVAVALVPWSVFLSLANDRFVPLSSMQGVVLWFGAGGITLPDGEPGAALVPTLVDVARGVLAIELGRDVACRIFDPECERRLAAIALARWTEFPFTTIAFGMAKVLHALGFSLRGPADWASAAFNLSAIGAGLWLYRRPPTRPLAALFLGVLVVVVVQAFVYQPDQRFRVMWLDFLSAVVLGTAVSRHWVRTAGARWSGRADGAGHG